MKNLITLVITLIATLSYAIPANDDCTSAANITIAFNNSLQVNFDTSTATVQSGTSGCTTGNGSTVVNSVDVWYSFTIPTDTSGISTYNLSVFSYATRNNFTLFESSCGGLELECFNKEGYAYTLNKGTTYYLRVYRAATEATGSFQYFWIQPFETSQNDICADATTVSVTTNYQIKNFELRGTQPADNETTDCNSITDEYMDVWYEFNMPIAGNLYIYSISIRNKFTLYDACNGSVVSCFNGAGSHYIYNLNTTTNYKLKVYRKTTEAANSFREFGIQAFTTSTNDICTDAATLSVTTNYQTENFELRGTQPTNNETTDCNSITDEYMDVWYEFNMPVAGNLYIYSISSRNKFTLYDACSGGVISCFDGAGSHYMYNLNTTTNYKLKVYRKTSEAANNFREFGVQAFATSTNDICADTAILSVTTNYQVENFELRGTQPADNETTDCNSITDEYMDVWYEFNMPVTGNLYIYSISSRNKFTLYDACSGNIISCFDGTGSHYMYNLNTTTNYKLKVYRKTSEAANSFREFGVQAIETATNDLCLDALSLSIGVYDEFLETKTLFGASASTSTLPPNTCGSNSGEDVWFTIQVPNSGDFTIETSQVNGSTLNDTILQVFSGSCNSFIEITCDDNSGEGNFSKVTISGRAPSEILYVRVSENGGNIDTYNIFAYDNDCTSKTIWNGTSWSNLAPTSSSIAVFDDNYTASTIGLDMCICKINNNATITIEGGKYFNLTDDLINEGHIVLNNQASFVQTNENATIIGTGSFITKTETNPLTDARYTYFSSPVQNTNVNTFNSWAQMNRIYHFNGATQNWELSNSFDTMTPGKGYIVRPPNPVTFNYPTTGTATSFVGKTNFQGKFNTGNITHPITYNAGGLDNDNELVGNPYPSAIETSLLFSDNPRANAFYFWTHENAEVLGAWADDYAIYNNTGYTSGNASTPAPTYIASGQGFFVTGNSGVDPNPELTFKNTQRVKDQNNQFLRSTNDNNLAKIWVNLSINNTNINSQVLIGFNPLCTNSFDPQYDARRFDSGSPISFYSIGTGSDTEKLAIQTRPQLTNTDTVILIGFIHNDDIYSSFKISIDHFENLNNNDVFIHDLELNIIHNLKTGDYNFTNNNVGNINQRFELIFSQNILSIDNNILKKEKLIVSQNNSLINVKTAYGSNISEIQVFDLLGKQLYKNNVRSNNHIIDITNLSETIILLIKVN